MAIRRNRTGTINFIIMTAEEILSLKNIQQELSLLKNNLSPLSDSQIRSGVRFYLNHHDIENDPNLADELIKEKIIDPETKKTTFRTYVKKRTKLSLPYPQQIVMTCTAFIMGKGINLVFNSENQKDIDSYSKFVEMWNKSNIISALREAAKRTFIGTRSLVQFMYESDSEKVKCKVIYEDGNYHIYRHKDENGRMDAIVVTYLRDKIEDGVLHQNVDTTEIYLKDRWYRYEGLFLVKGFPKKNPEGTTKLLFAYFEQEYPEFWFVMELVNKQDYARSQHSDVNTRIGNPAMVVNGELKKKPLINDALKIYEINPKKGTVTDTPSSTADMKYLEVKGAPESVKLELENNERDIYRFTYPDLYSLINKAISGNLSSKSIMLMFTHVFAKIAEKQTIWDDMIRRCISIMEDICAAITGDDNVRNLNIDFKYNSILPSSTDDLVKMLSIAVGSHLTTYERASSQLDFNDPDVVNTIKDFDTDPKTGQIGGVEIPTDKDTDENPNQDGVNGM